MAIRVEATIPEVRVEQLAQLATELGISRSQVMDEALTLYLTAANETRHGRRMAFVDAETHQSVREVIIPALSQLEWMSQHEREHVVLPDAEFDRVQELIANPPPKTEKLKRALAKRDKPKRDD